MYKELSFKEKLKRMDREELEKYAEDETNKRRKAKRLLEDIFIAANKQFTALTEIINDYSYNKDPNPRLALKYLDGKVYDAHSRQSFKWFYEYRRIIWFITVAWDYSSQILKFEAQYKELRGKDA